MLYYINELKEKPQEEKEWVLVMKMPYVWTRRENLQGKLMQLNY